MKAKDTAEIFGSDLFFRSIITQALLAMLLSWPLGMASPADLAPGQVLWGLSGVAVRLLQQPLLPLSEQGRTVRAGGPWIATAIGLDTLQMQPQIFWTELRIAQSRGESSRPPKEIASQ